MLKNRIIPCLDIKDGRVVKGKSFVGLIDAGDPVELAKYYYENEVDELCFLDITAHKENRTALSDLVNKIAKVCFIPLTVGGGIKELQDFEVLLNSGADKISINSSAFKNPSLISSAVNKYGRQCVVCAVDVKKHIQGWFEVYINGGSVATGIEAIAWIKKLCELGAGEIILTSIDKDGTKSGYDLELLNKVCKEVDVPVIASGGAGSLEHLKDGVEAGASGILAASIFHFKQISISEAKRVVNPHH